MPNIIEQTIHDLIDNHEENKKHLDENNTNFASTNYNRGYFDGYHDALVDLLNNLGYEHNYEIYNE